MGRRVSHVGKVYVLLLHLPHLKSTERHLIAVLLDPGDEDLRSAPNNIGDVEVALISRAPIAVPRLSWTILGRGRDERFMLMVGYN